MDTEFFLCNHFAGIGNGSLYHTPANLFEENGSVYESDTSLANHHADTFIFFLKNVCVLTQTSSDNGSEERTYRPLVCHRFEVPRSAFAADTQRIGRDLVLTSTEDAAHAVAPAEFSLIPEDIDALAQSLASVALAAAAENDPVLQGPPSASGHRGLPVFLLMFYAQEHPEEHWEDYEQAAVETAAAAEEEGALVVSRPAAPSAIEALETCTAPSAGEAPCAVCFEEFGDGEKDAVRLPCSHVYHRDCAVRWLETSNLCPLCRYALPTETKTN